MKCLGVFLCDLGAVQIYLQYAMYTGYLALRLKHNQCKSVFQTRPANYSLSAVGWCPAFTQISRTIPWIVCMRNRLKPVSLSEKWVKI